MSPPQRRHGDNRDGTAAWESARPFRRSSPRSEYKGTRHGVLRRNLVHTVRHDGQRIGVQSHVREQHQHLFILVDSEILGGGKRHVGNEQTLHRRILGRIDEPDDTVERTGILEDTTLK